MKIKIENKLL